REGASLWLHRRLLATKTTLDAEAAALLGVPVKEGSAQCLRVDVEAGITAELLHAAGIPFVLLKGAAMRSIANRVSYADARAPGDLDILCRAPDARHAWDTLRTAGYVAPKPGPDDQHHLPGLLGRTGVGVDVHVTTVPQVSPAEAWRRAAEGGRPIMMGG